MKTAELCAAFGVGESTVNAKARAIERALGPSRSIRSGRSRAWPRRIRRCGWLLVDLRDMPREVQEIAFEDGLIPYIPADRKERP
jgi:hypothetical protein